jgi:hypothetical protein
MQLHPVALRKAASASTSAGAICPAICPLPPGVHTLSSTEAPPNRNTLVPSRPNIPIRSAFAPENSGPDKLRFSYANPTKFPATLPTTPKPTVNVAAVIAPTGSGCWFATRCPLGNDIPVYSDEPHPVNTDDAAIAENPNSIWRREIIGNETAGFKTNPREDARVGTKIRSPQVPFPVH